MQDQKDHEELYVINRESGQAIFHQALTDINHDADLFASLLSAILLFAETASNKTMSNFNLKNRTITIASSQSVPLIYVYIKNKENNKKKQKKQKKLIQDTLKIIKEEFEKTYSFLDITSWRGNVSAFSGFSDTLEDILKPWSNFQDIF